MKRTLDNENGAALLVTLLVVVIMTVTVTEFLYSTWVEKSLVANFRDDARAVSVVGSAVEAAREVIKGSSDSEMNELVTFYPEVPLLVDDNYAFVKIVDESGKLDLNLLADDTDSNFEKRIAVFRRLLEVLELNPDITNAVVDWIDSNGEINGAKGAEDGWYQSLENPYRCKNAKLDSLKELKRIRGIDSEVFAKIREFVTIKSDDDKNININTAPPEILMALHEDISKSIAKKIVSRRLSEFFEDKLDIKDISGIDDTVYTEISSIIDVSGDTYSVSASIKFNEVARTARAIYAKNGSEKSFASIVGGLS